MGLSRGSNNVRTSTRVKAIVGALQIKTNAQAAALGKGDGAHLAGQNGLGHGEERCQALASGGTASDTNEIPWDMGVKGRKQSVASFKTQIPQGC